jgi:hypothetical protein
MPARQDGNQSERNLRRPRSCATCTIRSEKISSRKRSRFGGVDRFTRRGGTCRLHAIFVNQLCIIWGYQEELSSTVGWREELAASICCPQHLRLYVPSLEEATHPRCDCEGYPDWPGRASSKEGES